MPLIGTLTSGDVLHARLSLPAPDTNYIISGIKVNNGTVSSPDDTGLIHLWVVPEAIVADVELSSESTNVITNKAINYVKLTNAQKEALIGLLDN